MCLENCQISTRQRSTSSKSTIKTLGKGVKYAQN